MNMPSLRRTAVLALVGAGLVTSSACFGSFNLTRKVYGFNQTVSEDKWVKEVVFLAFTIVPIYSVAAGIDALIINSIEFWTGENPVVVSNTLNREDGGRVVQTSTITAEERTMTFEEYVAGQRVSTTTVRRATGAESVTVEVRYADGRVESRTVSRLDDGSVLVEQR
jgi:hypothetical protein